MKCFKCNNVMKSVKMSGSVQGIPLYLSYKKKGVFETAKESAVECFVCANCGYVELCAKTPEIFNGGIPGTE